MKKQASLSAMFQGQKRALEESELPEPKRGRGRPKGSAKKPEALAAEAREREAEAEEPEVGEASGASSSIAAKNMETSQEG